MDVHGQLASQHEVCAEMVMNNKKDKKVRRNKSDFRTMQVVNCPRLLPAIDNDSKTRVKIRCT